MLGLGFIVGFCFVPPPPLPDSPQPFTFISEKEMESKTLAVRQRQPQKQTTGAERRPRLMRSCDVFSCLTAVCWAGIPL